MVPEAENAHFSGPLGLRRQDVLVPDCDHRFWRRFARVGQPGDAFAATVPVQLHVLQTIATFA